jgi:hypothetical protein
MRRAAEESSPHTPCAETAHGVGRLRFLRLRSGPRRAIILPCVLAALVIAILVGGALLETVLLDHRDSRRSEARQQALWLAESALQRAVQAAVRAPDYRGETWDVPAEVLGAGRSGRAVIRVEPAAAPQRGRRLQVQAYYPEGTADQVLFEREAFIPSAN